MFAGTAETKIQAVRLALLIGWVVILSLCVVDMGQSRLTDSHDAKAVRGLVGKPVRLRGKVFEPQPYNPAPRLFWGVAIPLVVLLLIFVGHDTWRRICPLSAVNQIPRWLGWQRKKGKGTQRRVALVGPESWLARNAIGIQFVLFVIGVTLRLTVLSANPMALFLFTLLVLLSTLIVGVLFGGKTWCNYFCPMNPIQLVISGPRGLNAAPAMPGISQSMCRKSGPQDDISTCVGCNSPCPDIDMERHYWEHLPNLQRRFVVYGYLGTVLGFIHGMFAAGGNFGYGPAIWYDSDWRAIGFSPFATQLPIPRMLGSALLMAAWIGFTFVGCMLLERFAFILLARRYNDAFALEMARHRVMTLATLTALLLLLFWIALPGMGWLPQPLVTGIGLASTVALAIWTHRSWTRSSAQYQRESLAVSLQRQLQLNYDDWSAHLNGRQLQELNADEIHLLAGLVPKLEHTHRLDFYQAFLADVITQGTADTWEGRKILQELRASCGVSEDEHRQIVRHLGGDTDDDTLLISPALRMNSFRQQLEKLVLEAVANDLSVTQAVEANAATIRMLREEYAITQHEENQIVTQLVDQSGPLLPLVDSLIEHLFEIRLWQRVLSSTMGEAYLSNYLQEQAMTIVRQSFGMLEVFADRDDLLERLAGKMKAAHTNAVDAVLHDPSTQWQTILPDRFLKAIQQQAQLSTCDYPISKEAVFEKLTTCEDRLVALVTARTAHLYGFKWAQKTLLAILDELDITKENKQLYSDNASEKVLRITTQAGDSILCRQALKAGRAGDNDWVIMLPQASRYHFRLFKRGQTFYCEDLNSANGTMVNGKIVRGGTISISGDCEIRLAPNLPPASIAILDLPLDDLHNPVDRFIACAVMPVFHQLPQLHLMRLVKHSQCLHVAARKRIDKLFHSKFSTCVVVSGEVELIFSDHYNTLLQRGDLLTAGDIGILHGSVVRTTQRVDLIVFNGAIFNQVMTQNKLFRADVLEHTNRSLQQIFAI